MEELFRRLFGITSGIPGQDQPVAQAFPLGQGQVEIAPISAGDMPIAQPVVPQVVPQIAQQQGFSASQFLPSMDAMRNALPSMENLRGIIPTFAGLEGRINEAITPQLPAYMQGLLGTEVEAQLPAQARRAGLLNAAAALMQASGPQDRRISLGQALGAGLQGYQQGSQGTFEDVMKGLKLRAELAPKSNLTDDIKEYQFAISQGYKGTFKDYQEGMKSAGAIKIMNEGQSGFDNELKIKGAFSGEPVYKGYQEMKAAHNQITDAIKQNSPAGDLAAATKFMKLLDPGSVVRESELFMAMQASGALDRAVNYAQMRINGTKLTPDQRKDFQSLADKLYAASVNSFNQKQREYADIAKAYKLDPNRAVGKPAVFGKQIKVDF
jgi:hypothetical protein